VLTTYSRTEARRTLLLLGMCLFVAIVATPVRPGVVVGESMAPAFRSGQVFLSSKVTSPQALRPDDVVLLSVDGHTYIKRIYAVAGQTVWGIRSPGLGEGFDRVVAPSDVPALRSLVTRHPGVGEVAQIRVPDGHVYVLGDSANNSLDSRHFGPVPWQAIRACVVVKSMGHLWRDNAGGTQIAATAQSRP